MNIKKILKNLDFALLTTVGILVLIGLTMVFSATYHKINTDPYFFFKRQLIATLIGLVIATILLFYDYRISDQMSLVLYGFNIFLLLLVLSPLGKEVNGARSWLFFFQPSELSKLITIITLAKYLAEKERLSSLYDFIGPFALCRWNYFRCLTQ